jgi:putative phosphoesterase
VRRKSQVRIGVLSDVHGDIHALRGALEQIDRLDANEVVCAGDLLDWGPFPTAVVELLQARGIPCVRGNHDFIDSGGDQVEVSRVLSPGALAVIERLPMRWERTIAGVRVAIWHASPGDTMRGIYSDRAPAVGSLLQAAAADVLIVGHTHVPMHLASPAGSIVNPGSVLRDPPTTEPIRASGTFGLLELPSRRFTVHRVTDGAEMTPATLPFPSGSYPRSGE